jgi:hypothetical protein
MQDQLENNKTNPPQVPPDSDANPPTEATSDDEYSIFQEGGNE